ncbi:M48 family metalloprotease [Actinoallomurus purpureus]|uniref:M48 family metalloprotease n=1 Tax=Actinoallomurus purpureus TaxID=478114 RepID=UPI002093133A|nr:M48 family metalloprotease [Actinoallomurus purpureus]MCO6011031.1 M48 family metalloprotease [Actinoallomurus purpureus]
MIVTLFLLGHALLLATAGTAALRRAGWPTRAPRLAIAAWLALSASIVGSVILAGLTATTAATRAGSVPGRCYGPMRWPCAPDTFSGAAALAATGAVAALAVAARVVGCLCAAYRTAARERRLLLDALALVGRTDARLGVTVVDHAAPAAYCVPGRHGRIVVTSGALAALDDARLAAVLAHERAHMRQLHHLALTSARGLARAFGPLPAFTTAQDQIAFLAELAADDAAAKRSGRLTVAEALLALAEAAPADAMAAGGTATGARARRLITGSRPLGRTRILLGLTAAAAVLTAPPAAAEPALSATVVACCGSSHTTATQPGHVLRGARTRRPDYSAADEPATPLPRKPDLRSTTSRYRPATNGLIIPTSPKRQFRLSK